MDLLWSVGSELRLVAHKARSLQRSTIVLQGKTPANAWRDVMTAESCLPRATWTHVSLIHQGSRVWHIVVNGHLHCSATEVPSPASHVDCVLWSLCSPPHGCQWPEVHPWHGCVAGVHKGPALAKAQFSTLMQRTPAPTFPASSPAPTPLRMQPFHSVSDALAWKWVREPLLETRDTWHPVHSGTHDGTTTTAAASPMPRLVVCHDMMGGYGKDALAQGTHGLGYWSWNHWAVTDVFIYFSHHRVSVPPVSWIRAAHVNGCKVLGTLIFEWDAGSLDAKQWLHPTSDPEDAHAFEAMLVRLAQVYGFDGWFINVEADVPCDDVPILLERIEWLRHTLKQSIGTHAEVIWYDSVACDTGKRTYENSLTPRNQPFFNVSDALFCNYHWHSLDQVTAAAQLAGARRCYDVLTGIDVWGRNTWGGGQWNTSFIMDAIAKRDTSVALFAPGWTHERTRFRTNVSSQSLAHCDTGTRRAIRLQRCIDAHRMLAGKGAQGYWLPLLAEEGSDSSCDAWNVPDASHQASGEEAAVRSAAACASCDTLPPTSHVSGEWAIKAGASPVYEDGAVFVASHVWCTRYQVKEVTSLLRLPSQGAFVTQVRLCGWFWVRGTEPNVVDPFFARCVLVRRDPATHAFHAVAKWCSGRCTAGAPWQAVPWQLQHWVAAEEAVPGTRWFVVYEEGARDAEDWAGHHGAALASSHVWLWSCCREQARLSVAAPEGDFSNPACRRRCVIAPFDTSFNCGEGDALWHAGRIVDNNGSDNHGTAWNNPGLTSVCPWQPVDALTSPAQCIGTSTCWDAAWNGGSCLRLQFVAPSSPEAAQCRDAIAWLWCLPGDVHGSDAAPPRNAVLSHRVRSRDDPALSSQGQEAYVGQGKREKVSASESSVPDSASRDDAEDAREVERSIADAMYGRHKGNLAVRHVSLTEDDIFALAGAVPEEDDLVHTDVGSSPCEQQQQQRGDGAVMKAIRRAAMVHSDSAEDEEEESLSLSTSPAEQSWEEVDKPLVMLTPEQQESHHASDAAPTPSPVSSSRVASDTGVESASSDAYDLLGIAPLEDPSLRTPVSKPVPDVRQSLDLSHYLSAHAQDAEAVAAEASSRRRGGRVKRAAVRFPRASPSTSAPEPVAHVGNGVAEEGVEAVEAVGMIDLAIRRDTGGLSRLKRAATVATARRGTASIHGDGTTDAETTAAASHWRSDQAVQELHVSQLHAVCATDLLEVVVIWSPVVEHSRIGVVVNCGTAHAGGWALLPTGVGAPSWCTEVSREVVRPYGPDQVLGPVQGLSPDHALHGPVHVESTACGDAGAASPSLTHLTWRRTSYRLPLPAAGAHVSIGLFGLSAAKGDGTGEPAASGHVLVGHLAVLAPSRAQDVQPVQAVARTWPDASAFMHGRSLFNVLLTWSTALTATDAPLFAVHQRNHGVVGVTRATSYLVQHCPSLGLGVDFAVQAIGASGQPLHDDLTWVRVAVALSKRDTQ